MTETKRRLGFIDQFRGWAVLFMVETHVLNAFLRSDLWGKWWYKGIDFLNGLVAPSFLFLAGFSFALNAVRKWDDFLAGKPALGKQFVRIAQIWLVGYLLRVPGLSLRRTFADLHWGENHAFWGVDILHCIAASLLLMLLLLLILRRRALYFSFLSASALSVILLSPLLYRASPAGFLPPILAGYFQRIRYSRFPLFPWLGYVLAGAVISFLWQRWRTRDQEELFFRLALLISLAAVLLTALGLFLCQPFDLPRFSMINPLFVSLKIGLVVLLLLLFQHLERCGLAGFPMVACAGQESLLAYGSHLALIYSIGFCPGGRTLDSAIGTTRSPAEIVGMTIMLAALVLLLVQFWHGLKIKNLRLARLLHLLFWLAVLILLLR